MSFPTQPPQYNLNPPSQPFPICRLSTCGKQLYRTDKVVAINAETAFHVDCAIRMGIELIATATDTDPALLPVTDNLLQMRFGKSVSTVIPAQVNRSGVLSTTNMIVEGEYCAACGSDLPLGSEVRAYVPQDPQAAILYFDPGCVYALGMVLKGEL